MLVPSFDRQQAHTLLERLAKHLREELTHPSQIAELDSSATLADYCQLFFLKRECQEATKEQNKLLCQLAFKQKIYIFNLKKMHAIIYKTCCKIDQALAVFRPQMHIIEEFKQTAAKTHQLQAGMLHTIDQSLDTVAQIRAYTFIPSQEGEPPNPLLTIMQAECDTLRTHLEYVQKLNQENEQAPEMADLRQAVRLYHKQADDFLCLSQECEEEIKLIRQGTQALRLEGQKLRQEGQELAKGVQEFGKDVAKLRQEGQELTQNVSGLEQDMIGLKQDMSGLKQDMIGLKQDMKELSNRAKRYGQGVDEVTKGVKELELWQQNFRSELAFHMKEAKKSRYLMDEIERKLALAEQLLTPPRYSSPCKPAAKKPMAWLKTIISWAWQAPFHLRYKICLIFLFCMKMFRLSKLWSYCKNGRNLLKHKHFCPLHY